MTGIYNGIYSNPDIQYVYGALLIIMLIFVSIYSFVKYEIWKIIKLIMSLMYYIIVNNFYRIKDLLNNIRDN